MVFGLNNLNKSDCLNATVQALAHVTCVPFVISFYDAVPVNPLAKNANDPKVIHVNPSKPLVPSSKPWVRYFLKYGPPIDSNPHWMRIRWYMPFPSHRIRHTSINQGIKHKHRTLWLLHQLHIGMGGSRTARTAVVKSITHVCYSIGFYGSSGYCYGAEKEGDCCGTRGGGER